MNAICPLAVGRKIHLVAGSHDGTKRAAIIYSLVATTKCNGVEPFGCFKDILACFPDYSHNKFADMLPQNWQPQS